MKVIFLCPPEPTPAHTLLPCALTQRAVLLTGQLRVYFVWKEFALSERAKEEVIIFLFWSKLKSERWAWNRAIQIPSSDLCPLHIHSSEKKAAWRTTVFHKHMELEDKREWLNTRLNASFMLMITYRDLINDSVQGIVRGFALPFSVLHLYLGSFSPWRIMFRF